MARYKYSYHEERGEFNAYVEDSNGKTIWEVHYPDLYEDEETGELVESSTIFEDGFVKSYDDVEGLEDYLKSMGVLNKGDELVTNDEYAEGGETDSNTFEKVKVTIRDVDMGGDVAYKGEHWFRKDQLAKKTNKEIGDYILRKYGLDYGNTYKYSIVKTGETKQKMAKGGIIQSIKNKLEIANKLISDGKTMIDIDEGKEVKYMPLKLQGKRNDLVITIKVKENNRWVNYHKYLVTEWDEGYGEETRLEALNRIIKELKTSKVELLADGGIMASGGILENKLKKKLSESFELPMEMAVYVPSTDKANIIISKRDYASRIEEVETFLSDLFGGYSAVSVDGGYISNDKGLIQEDVTRVATFGSTENFESKFTKLINKVVDWCNKWGQESMGFEFEGDMFYIDHKASFKHGGEVIKK